MTTSFYVRGAAVLVLFAVSPANVQAQLLDIITSPKTLIDRAIEARKTADIYEDNKIVLAVNGIMADLGTIKASTEIYEQRLLITGMFDDKKLYDKFRSEVKKISNIKRLYWHVTYMSEANQKKNEKKLMNWSDTLVLDTKVGLSLVGTRGVAVDTLATVYLIGRARSTEELKKTLSATRKTDGVKKIINYVEVRP